MVPPIDTAVIVDVILPTLDEAAALPGLLAAMPMGYRAIVVDNGSTDGSADIATAAGALVVHEAQQGFGAACWRGLNTATAEVVCFMDADGSLDPRDLPTVCDPVLRDEFDLVLGARIVATGAMPAHARLANRYLGRRIRRMTGVPLTDLGPMRAMRRSALLDLGLEDRRSGWPLEMVLRAAEAHWRILEVRVPYAKRSGRSKVTGTAGGTARAVRDMSRWLREFA